MPPVEHRWRKGGPSPNPGGRPKNLPITEALRKALTPRACELLVKRIIRQAQKSGKAKEWEPIADRIEGKPIQRVAHGGDGEAGAIQIILTNAKLPRYDEE